MRPTLRIDPDSLRPYLVDLGGLRPGFRWPEVFGRVAPVELELGSGKGQWLLESASAFPERNFAGVEIRERLAFYTAGRLKKHGLMNVRVIPAEALALLRDRVPPGSLDAVHLHFPDPWWKARHRHRRIFRPVLFLACERALRPGGRLCVASDVAPVFDAILAAVASGTSLRRNPSAPATEETSPVPSNFERKAQKGGRSVQRATFQKALGN